MSVPASLRLRLFAIIVAPLILIATGAALWRVNEARDTAQDLYDRNLLVTALALARDVATLDGDYISPETESLLRAAAGGPVRYHVYAPDGVFVTGYATPPVPLRAQHDLTLPALSSKTTSNLPTSAYRNLRKLKRHPSLNSKPNCHQVFGQARSSSQSIQPVVMFRVVAMPMWLQRSCRSQQPKWLA